jgi:hypothetical protein
MKNFFGAYKDHPEVIFILLIALLFFLFLVPIFHLYLTKKKQASFQSLLAANPVAPDRPSNDTIKCEFCGSSRTIKELIAEVPVDVRFGLLTVKKKGRDSLYQLRCASCNSKLFLYRVIDPSN